MPEHQISVETLQQHLGALPPVGAGSILSELQVSAAEVVLSSANPGLHNQMTAQIDALHADLRQKLDYDPRTHRYLLPEQALRATLARAVLTGAMQASYDTGKRLHDAHQLESLLYPHDDETIGDDTL